MTPASAKQHDQLARIIVSWVPEGKDAVMLHTERWMTRHPVGRYDVVVLQARAKDLVSQWTGHPSYDRNQWSSDAVVYIGQLALTDPDHFAIAYELKAVECAECGAPLMDWEQDKDYTACLKCRGPRDDTVAEREGLR